jgi:hypothetical protein
MGEESMNTSTNRYFLLIFCLLIILMQGCAVGNKYNFSNIRADLQVSGSHQVSVAVATLDKRDVVVTQECAPTYVGMQRAGLGNPWRVNTESGLPLADDITKAVSESLTNKGFSTQPVYVAFAQTENEAFKTLLEKKSRRSVFILLKKWESDTYVNIGLEYDLRLKVVSADQSTLAETVAAEKKTIQGSFWDPPAAAKEQIPLAFRQVLEKLLNDPNVVAALK